jgi:hypothetical protein
MEDYESERLTKAGHCVPVPLSVSSFERRNGQILGASMKAAILQLFGLPKMALRVD